MQHTSSGHGSKDQPSPLVTVGMPFSQERLDDFELALKSVLVQSISNWELLLIADGASQKLLDFATSIDDPRVRLVNDGERRGLPSRLNEIAHLARGRYLARMDADDVMHPERLERSVKVLDLNPGVDVLSTSAFQIDEQNEVLGRFLCAQMTSNRRELFAKSPIIHPTVVTRVGWTRNNPYNEEFLKAQDKELWVRALHPQNYIALEDELLFYRVARNLTYSKHRMTSSFDRKLIKAHGPTQLGVFATAKLIAYSFAKQVMYRILLTLGQRSRLYSRKFGKCSDAQLRIGAEVIRDISEVEVLTFS